MIKFCYALIVFASLLLIINCFFIDFSDMSWSVNNARYLGMFSMACLILSMALTIRNAKKQGIK